VQRDDAYKTVCYTFGEYFEVHPGQVLAHHDLRNDWGVSGSELELLAHRIEERLDIQLIERGELIERSDHAALAELKTIGQLVRLVRAQLRRAARIESDSSTRASSRSSAASSLAATARG